MKGGAGSKGTYALPILAERANHRMRGCPDEIPNVKRIGTDLDGVACKARTSVAIAKAKRLPFIDDITADRARLHQWQPGRSLFSR